jgi:hypothetical protein
VASRLVAFSELLSQIVTLSADSWAAAFPIPSAESPEGPPENFWLAVDLMALTPKESRVVSAMLETSVVQPTEELWRSEPRMMVPVSFVKELLTSWSSMRVLSLLVSVGVLLLSLPQLQPLAVSSSLGAWTPRAFSLLHLPGL